MGFFSGPPKGTQMYYDSTNQMRSHPELNSRHKDHHKKEETDEIKPKGSNDSHEMPQNNSNPEIQIGEVGDEAPGTTGSDKTPEATTGTANGETETKEGEGEVKKPREKKIIKVRNRERFDPQTSKNTHLNSLLYHTSNETVDLYTKENDSSDLLGRLYYDDFDSDSIKSPIVSSDTTPLMSPGGLTVGNDYFSSRPTLSPSKISPIGSRTTSQTNIRSPDSLIAIDEKLRKHQQAQLGQHHNSSGSSRVSTPSSKYSKGISFDTSTNTEKKSLTLKAKHPKFRFRRNNKTFLTGFNDDQESLRAIKWLFDEAIVSGDTIVVLQVLDDKMYREIDRERCNKSLEKIEDLNVHNKKISIVYEIVIGKPQKLLKKAIDEYTPQMMAIGTHQSDKEQHKSFFAKTTLSKYFLEYALVPVVVVKPRYNHVEVLPTPIDSADYFANWLKNIDISETYIKDKDKKKKILRSPLGSRSSSSVSLNTMNDERGRESDNVSKTRFLPRSGSSSRSQSKTRDEGKETRPPHKRGLSKFFHH